MNRRTALRLDDADYLVALATVRQHLDLSPARTDEQAGVINDHARLVARLFAPIFNTPEWDGFNVECVYSDLRAQDYAALAA